MREHHSHKILVIGYGNPAREDDGLGPLAAQAIEDLAFENVTVDTDYQLTLEHAKDLTEHDIVIFVDAMLHGDESYSFSKVCPVTIENCFSHSITPGEVLGLTNTVFNKYPQTYLFGIRGYSFRMFHESITEGARNNLESALRFLIYLVQDNTCQPMAQLVGFNS